MGAPGPNKLGIDRQNKIFRDAGGAECPRYAVLVNGPGEAECQLPAGPAAAEVVSLAITAAASAAGNVTVTLNDAATAIGVASADTASAVATKIRGTAFAGWTTGGSGATVTFTATAAEPRPGVNSYSAGDTGATGDITTTTEGASEGANAGSLAGVAHGGAFADDAVALSEHNYEKVRAAGAIPLGSRVNVADAQGRVKALNEAVGTVVTLVGIAEEEATAADQEIVVNLRLLGTTATT